jgi:hypothetical protein
MPYAKEKKEKIKTVPLDNCAQCQAPLVQVGARLGNLKFCCHYCRTEYLEESNGCPNDEEY